MRCLQDPNKSNVDNLKNVRREGSRHFRNKKKGYLKAKIDELESNSSEISETCMGASVTLRRITSL
jgi:IS5 family transposase